MNDAAKHFFSRPPSIKLPTPEGLYIDTTAPGTPTRKKKAVRFSEEVEDITALLSEPPPTPTEIFSSPMIATFTDGTSPFTPSSLGDGDEEINSDDSSATLVSPFIDPNLEEEGTTDGFKEEFISYWAVSSFSSSSSDDSESDSDDDMDDLHYYNADTAADHDGIRILCTDPNGLTSFPPLQPCPSGGQYYGDDNEDEDEVMKSPTYYEHLWGSSDEMIVDAEVIDVADELQDLVDEVEREYAEGAWRTSFSALSPVAEEAPEPSKPVPQWAWLTDSNSFPVVRPGSTGAFRHGQSKLRQSVSASDGQDKQDEEETARNQRPAQSGSTVTTTVAMVGVSYL